MMNRNEMKYLIITKKFVGVFEAIGSKFISLFDFLSTEKVRQIQDKLEEFIQNLNQEKWCTFGLCDFFLENASVFPYLYIYF